MCPYPWYQVMRLSKDKKQQRYQMVIHAKEHGVKPTARLYATTPKTVRKWLMRFIEDGYQALDDMSRRPHYSPRAVPEDDARHIVKLRAKYKRLGAEQVKVLENLAPSAKTIRKIWRSNGVSRAELVDAARHRSRRRTSSAHRYRWIEIGHCGTQRRRGELQDFLGGAVTHGEIHPRRLLQWRQDLDGGVPRRRRGRGRGLGHVADDRHRARLVSTSDDAQLHGREVLGFVDHDVAVLHELRFVKVTLDDSGHDGAFTQRRFTVVIGQLLDIFER